MITTTTRKYCIASFFKVENFDDFHELIPIHENNILKAPRAISDKMFL